jgi:hypothetical protein
MTVQRIEWTRRFEAYGVRGRLVLILGEALTRSITRDCSARLSPLLVTDNAGRFVGVARMERLIGRLAGGDAPTAP